MPKHCLTWASFDVQAPGIVGGGLDKAEQIAAQLEKIDPARAHQSAGRIARSRKDYATAESEFKAGRCRGRTSCHSVGPMLANFYRHRQRWNEMEAAVRRRAGTAARDRLASVALYNGAGVLIEANRDPALAAKMLEDYLAGNSKTDEAPAFVAYTRLGSSLEQQLGRQHARQSAAAAGPGTVTANSGQRMQSTDDDGRAPLKLRSLQSRGWRAAQLVSALAAAQLWRRRRFRWRTVVDLAQRNSTERKAGAGRSCARPSAALLQSQDAVVPSLNRLTQVCRLFPRSVSRAAADRSGTRTVQSLVFSLPQKQLHCTRRDGRESREARPERCQRASGAGCFDRLHRARHREPGT